jgi:hypothetical protein
MCELRSRTSNRKSPMPRRMMALLIKRGREEARRVWMEGIEADNRTGAWKAPQHMEALLASLADEAEPGFCE